MRWGLQGMVVGLIGLVAVGCGSDPVAPTAPPADAFPGFRASDPVQLELGAFAAEAVDPDALSVLLEETGFQGGVRRTWSGGPEIRRAEVKILGFETDRGAERYLDWLRTHVDELIGDVTPAAALKVPKGAVVFLHEPDPCCPKETAIAIAVWRRQDEVFRVLVAGPAVDAAVAADLAASVDRATGRHDA